MYQIQEFIIPETTTAKMKVLDVNGEIIDNFDDLGRTVPMVNIDDNWQVIPTVKSSRYNYLHHQDAAKYFVENLQKSLSVFQNPPEVRYSVQFSGKYSKMIIDAIIDKPYKLSNIKPFEKEFGGTWYTTENINMDDSFKPRIRLINSFDSASKIIFGLYRNICSNGMTFGKIFKTILKFLHIDKRIVSKFIETSEIFFNGIFEEELIEEVFNKMNSKQIETDELKEMINKNIGVRSMKIAEETFPVFDQKQLSGWVAYNIITFLLSHYIKDVMKSQYLMDKFARKFI